MLLASLVTVGQDEDVLALKVLVEVRVPIAGAAGIGRGDETKSRYIIDVLLALDDQDRVVFCR